MNPSDYMSIRVSTLRGDLPIPFDAYVRVAGKFILYCRKGDSFEGERLARLQKKKLDRMYIPNTDKQSYRDYLSRNVTQAYESNLDKPIQIRTEIIQGALQATVEEVLDEPGNPGFYVALKDSVRQFADFLMTEQESVACLLSIPNAYCNYAQHGINVAALALGIAHKTGLTKAKAPLIDAFLVGCTIHDIAHHRSNLQVDRPVNQLNPQERSSYLKHPTEGARILKDLAHVDQITLSVVLQHEERVDGSGFPKKTTGNQLDPLVTAAAVANFYDRMTSWEHIDHKEALTKILIDGVGSLPLDQLKALQAELKFRNVV
ncbi:MAG: HD domain-containing protein [Pseudobdellovibrionaceae bacterium]|nr:MAG: HD domain-containing protein [Pseudobdellovibrionaceae bacterium]